MITMMTMMTIRKILKTEVQREGANDERANNKRTVDRVKKR